MGNGTVPGAGGRTPVLGDLAKGVLGGVGGFCSIDVCCGSREGRRAPKIGRSLSRDGRDLSRDLREVERVEVRAPSKEGRGWMVGRGVTFDDAWLVNADRGNGLSL